MENKTYNVLQIAKYFIKKSREDKNNKITNLKLQKILYYAQGWHLGNSNNPLFDEKIEAWKYGPAVPIVYQQYKNFGSSEIDIDIKEEDINGISKETKGFLDSIWQVYGKLTGPELIFLTHKETPWREARKKTDDEGHAEITLGMMEDFFGKKLKNG